MNMMLPAVTGGVIGAFVGGGIAGYLHMLQNESYDGFWEAVASGALYGAIYGAIIGASTISAPLFAIIVSSIFGIQTYKTIALLTNNQIRPKVKVALIVILIASAWLGVRGYLKLRTPTIRPIQTPYGEAIQSNSPTALHARALVEDGAILYRIGTVGKSQAAEGQFWALEHPFSSSYANRYGIPPENIINADFIEIATIKPNTPFVTRPAPAVGINQGGGIEVVVPKGGVKMTSFHTE